MTVIIQKLKSLLFRPLNYAYKKYSQKERTTRIAGFKLRVLPGVFHPRLFFSTKFLVNHLEQYNMHDMHVLDVGSGSGALAIAAAKRGANVVAIDISEQAVANTTQNAGLNKIRLQALQSDLWNSLPLQTFDMLLVNPPYYPKRPNNAEEQAWYCGEDFEYFHRFFSGISAFVHPKSEIVMILSEDCDLEKIKAIARDNDFQMNLKEEKKIYWERNYIFNFKVLNAH